MLRVETAEVVNGLTRRSLFRIKIHASLVKPGIPAAGPPALWCAFHPHFNQAVLNEVKLPEDNVGIEASKPLPHDAKVLTDSLVRTLASLAEQHVFFDRCDRRFVQAAEFIRFEHVFGKMHVVL